MPAFNIQDVLTDFNPNCKLIKINTVAILTFRVGAISVNYIYQTSLAMGVVKQSIIKICFVLVVGALCSYFLH